MPKLKGVCIGAGYFSQFHFEAWQRLENVDIVGVYDLVKERAESVVVKYGFNKTYDDVEKMFLKERPDFVDIITPPETHLELCQLAIKHQIAIICQKPLAPTLAESTEIAKYVEKSTVRMMVHENFRFQPWHRELKKLLDQNVIGAQLHTIHLRMRMGDGWQTDAYMNRQPYFREMERLLIYETGIHFIDVFQYLMGDITQVYAKLKTLNPNIKGEDFAWVHFDFANQALGFLDANRYNENIAEDPRLTFGSVLIEGEGGSLRLYDNGNITIQPLGKQERPHKYAFLKQNFSGDCVFHTQSHFIENLISGNPFETDVTRYLRNIKVLEKVYESSEKGIPLPVD
ncbi:Gfo/Idh/MocA family oxidoreductase [uncultured Kriegella sp.]|uniref:Gfo/Idh/MocA family protein n=1 Tax=uncultured Kriegella sp. TaxID=1798910 RepID=UPI0030D87CA5|tara:strand:+ start:86607 stop:87635 length:1029 start_codon:yes stop_codon:yes gene_type:complete